MKKLKLSRETVRALATYQLAQVRGAGRYMSVDPTCAEYTEYRWCNSEPQYCSTTI